MFKKLLLAMVLVLSLSGLVLAQTLVAPGDGTLGAAIKAAASGDVLVLQNGGLYTESADLAYVINKRITIKAEDGAKSRPVLKMLSAPTGAISRPDMFYMMHEGAISLHFLDLDGFEPDTTTHRSLDGFFEIDTTANSLIPAIKMYDCLLHNTVDNLLDGNGDAFLGKKIKVDTLIAENTFFYHTTGFGFKTVALTYVKFENCTGWDVANRFFRMLDTDPEIFVNHCTFYSIGLEGERILEFRNKNSTAVVKNCIFVNGHPDNNVVRIDGVNGSFSNCAMKNVGKLNVKVPISDTLMTDPKFKDPDNGDFTLAADSPVLGKADDGKALGDLRWDPSNASAVTDRDRHMPVDFELSQNFPNPFNPATAIAFTLQHKGHVRLTVHNLLGQIVATLVDTELNQGMHVTNFDASGLDSGVYFYQLQSGPTQQFRKMMLIK